MSVPHLSKSRLLSAADIANLIAASTRTVYRMRDRGQLPPPLKVSSRMLRWRVEDVEAYLCDLQSRPDNE